MNPLLVPPRLAQRAIDDLGSVAGVVAGAPDELRAMDRRAREIVRLLTRLARTGDRMLERADVLIERTDAVLDRTDAVLQRLDDLDRRAVELGHRAQELGHLSDRIEDLVHGLMAQATVVGASADAIAHEAAEVAKVLPTLARAVEIAEPLEGAVDRVAWIVDRLPGGRSGAKIPEPEPAPKRTSRKR